MDINVNRRRLNKSKDSGDWIEVGFLLSNMLIIPGFFKLFKFRLLGWVQNLSGGWARQLGSGIAKFDD